MCMGSQGGNIIHNLPHIADFGLKCCILKEDTKNNITGSNIVMVPPSMPTNWAGNRPL
jgi:hypothetical protein